MIDEKLRQHYDVFIKEAEDFYITKFIRSAKIDEEYQNCLDVFFNITKTADTGKGLVAFNEAYGQGKTFIFDVCNHIYRRKNGRYFFIKTSAKELVQAFVEGGEPALLKKISCKNLLIDDIGDEGANKNFKHYSNELNVIRWVFMKRYEYWIDKGWRTFGTTNLTIGQIGKEYGGRAADRFKQMVHWRSFGFLANGKSFRQNTETRKLSNHEIKENWKKYMSPKEEQTIDVVGYMNEIIKEEDSYFESMNEDYVKWHFIRTFLIERKLIDPELIEDDVLVASVTHASLEAKAKAEKGSRHAGKGIQSIRAHAAKKNVQQNQVEYIAQAIMTKKVFMKLRESKHVFK